MLTHKRRFYHALDGDGFAGSLTPTYSEKGKTVSGPSIWFRGPSEEAVGASMDKFLQDEEDRQLRLAGRGKKKE